MIVLFAMAGGQCRFTDDAIPVRSRSRRFAWALVLLWTPAAGVYRAQTLALPSSLTTWTRYGTLQIGVEWCTVDCAGDPR